MAKDEYLITDSPLKALTIFAMPMILGSLFQQVYNMADSIIVGRFVGSSALAAVGACAALTNVFICVALGAGVGAGVLVSRYFGAKEYGKMKTVVSTSLLSFLVLSLLLSVFGFSFSYAMMEALQTPSDILKDLGAVSQSLFYRLSVPFYVQYSLHHVYVCRGIQNSAWTFDFFLHLKYFFGSLDGKNAWSRCVRRSPCDAYRTRRFRRTLSSHFLLSNKALSKQFQVL